MFAVEVYAIRQTITEHRPGNRPVTSSVLAAFLRLASIRVMVRKLCNPS